MEYQWDSQYICTDSLWASLNHSWIRSRYQPVLSKMIKFHFWQIYNGFKERSWPFKLCISKETFRLRAVHYNKETCIPYTDELYHIYFLWFQYWRKLLWKIHIDIALPIISSTVIKCEERDCITFVQNLKDKFYLSPLAY